MRKIEASEIKVIVRLKFYFWGNWEPITENSRWIIYLPPENRACIYDKM